MVKVPPEPGASHALALVHVPFEGTEIDAALNGEEGRTIWISARRVCEALGVALQRQLQKLKEKEWACVTLKVTQVGDQRRELAMVDVDTLAMWLATIEPARVKESARPLLIAYQKRAARVLREHFFPNLGPPAALPEREPPEPPELAAAAELLGGMDPRVRAALRKLPRPRRPSVEHWLDQARELGALVERSDVPIPLDPLACARLASSLILATGSVPDHPLVLGSREDLRRTLATIDRLLSRAADDADLRDRVADLRARWSTEAARFGPHGCHQARMR